MTKMKSFYKNVYLYFKTKNNFTGRLLMKSHIWISMEKLILQKRSYTVAIGCPILQMIWSCCQRYREITLIRKLILKLHRLNFWRLLSRMLILTYCVIRAIIIYTSSRHQTIFFPQAWSVLVKIWCNIMLAC